MSNKTKFNPHARRKARRLLVQALYQWQLADHTIAVINEQFAANDGMAKIDAPYFQELLQAIPPKCAELDAALAPFLDRPVAELDPVELTILRIGAYELAEQLGIPYRVVINEAIDLAKMFGALDGHKYINGVLDRLARNLRAAEM
jgi:N utilization substance protein B